MTVKEWRAMGKIKAWLMDMEEDATILPRSEWVKKHGMDREYIFDKIGGGLRLVEAHHEKPKIGDDEARNFGVEWIRANGFEDEFAKEIRQRVDQGIVDPVQILGKSIRGKKKVVRALLDHVGLNMVKRYQNQYVTVERTDEG